jgi:hypothetical protein
MIPIPTTWIVYGLIALGVGGYVLHCEHVKKVQAQSVAIAQEQARENAKKALADVKAKERSDENYRRNISRLSADLKRLRDSRPSIVPAAPAGAPRPELACFDRAELVTALRTYREGVIGLLGEGAAAVEGLDEARVWAAGR